MSSAAVSAWLLVKGRDRAAGALLLLSVVTPTVFVWPLNVAALVAGMVLVVSGSMGRVGAP